jgi:hypothetical protein
MKRYLLFAGSAYYPLGGWDDFKGDFDDAKEAMARVAHLQDDWWHLVDIEEGKQIATGGI